MSPLQTLFLFLLISIHVSPARSRYTISHLPGFSGPLPFRLETGYVTVDEEKDVQIFYYFVESEGNPREDPLLIWISGGPGCSSLSGLAFQVGPLKFKIVEYDGGVPMLEYSPYSWTKVSSIIFVDSPVGSGFSFSSLPEGYQSGDIFSSKQVYKFLQKWIIDHPHYLANPLYIAGDSYSGKVVPVITQEFVDGIEAGHHPIFNLKGYLVGNPRTNEKKIDYSFRVPHAHGMGIISDELYESTKTSCGGNYVDPVNEQCATNLEAINKFFSELYMENILEPNCNIQSPKQRVMVGDRRSMQEKNKDFIKAEPPRPPGLYCKNYNSYLSYYWANNDEVREALHVKKGSVSEWLRCNREIPYSQDVSSSIAYHKSLTSKGYRALVYSGDHDMVIPFLGTEAWIRSLNFSIVDDWRSWHVGLQVAGYTRTYSNNLTFATVKGAGHLPGEYRPMECLAMFKRWISHNPL